MTAGRINTSKNFHWCTPQWLAKRISAFLGGIDLDPCGHPKSVVGARRQFLLPTADGLVEPWNARTIYVNPPYGADRERGTTIRDWLSRCAEEHHSGAEVVALVPVATNTSHWKRHVWGTAAGVCFLRDTRLKFSVGGSEDNKGAPMSCALVYWGKRLDAFSESFFDIGATVPTLCANRNLK